jgi:hypothetical protein
LPRPRWRRERRARHLAGDGAQRAGRADRAQCQATNDFIVFGTVACTAFASGAIAATGGWAALNAVVVPTVLIACGLVVWHSTAGARLAAVVQ